MGNTVGIKYQEAEVEIERIEKAIEDLYTNVELIDKNTNGISKDTWVGKDADAYQEKILGYSDKLKKQTDSFKELVEKLKDVVAEFKAEEEKSATKMSGEFSYGNEYYV
ncbi:MAG: hypothetical protein HXK72_01275 [Clostridiales bacterium]|nr:hypothetical protein [Clostridiales bacterium]